VKSKNSTKKIEMKPVKITAEITVTPEMFIEWCGQDDYLKNEEKYKDYVESWVHSKFSSYGKFFGKYDYFINKTIPDNGNGLKIIIQEV